MKNKITLCDQLRNIVDLFSGKFEKSDTLDIITNILSATICKQKYIVTIEANPMEQTKKSMEDYLIATDPELIPEVNSKNYRYILDNKKRNAIEKKIQFSFRLFMLKRKIHLIDSIQVIVEDICKSFIEILDAIRNLKDKRKINWITNTIESAKKNLKKLKLDLQEKFWELFNNKKRV